MSSRLGLEGHHQKVNCKSRRNYSFPMFLWGVPPQTRSQCFPFGCPVKWYPQTRRAHVFINLMGGVHGRCSLNGVHWSGILGTLGDFWQRGKLAKGFLGAPSRAPEFPSHPGSWSPLRFSQANQRFASNHTRCPKRIDLLASCGLFCISFGSIVSHGLKWLWPLFPGPLGQVSTKSRSGMLIVPRTGALATARAKLRVAAALGGQRRDIALPFARFCDVLLARAICWSNTS